MSNLTTQAGANVTKNRNLYVGGSDIPTILGINKYKTQFELAQEKVGIKPNEFKGNEYTEFGNIMEPQIRDYINAVNSIHEVHFKEKTMVDEERNIRSNVDGFDAEYGLLLEIKTHGKNLDTKPYIAQMQLYMWHLGIEEGWLALYERPDNFDTEFDPNRLQIEVIERDDEFIQKILNAIETFWIRCEFLKDNPNAAEQEFIDFGQNEVMIFAREVSKLEMQLAEFKEIEKQYKEAKQQLHDAMEAYDIKKYETDVVTVTRVLPGERKSFDSKRFKQDYPDLAEEYQKMSKTKGSVRIKVKEDK
ncbi:phage-related protein, endonuclease of lambda exonuclease [Gracilibacillus halophilus YIM-C55.5]|uniref:Phage-related protein, endonuclease of lambda exonuclease n=1 Tax=Gracilibacillus halophilus YIM-C55.5 TaxID=1308866 RepID=N4WKL6_9BACI|nr:YqaJ viral recombinase family protein [Gracilibacillus halophilus]ENH96702.1 phage-related protein, endonuclease of lambda exonuclease [Gracilibacillus halophilus YIM-C55.5]